MTATFHAKRVDTTNSRSGKRASERVSRRWRRSSQRETRTKVFRQEGNANDIKEERDHLGDDHVRMPMGKRSGNVKRRCKHNNERRAYQVVISNATMISSFRMSEVKEMETIFKNSVSKRTRETSIIAAPAFARIKCKQDGSSMQVAE